MKLSLLQIVKEEVERYYSDTHMDDDQNVIDRYYAKNIGVVSKPEIEIDAELFGHITRQEDAALKTAIPVYKNPRNLNGFAKDARGVIMNNGDFYLGQTSNSVHDNLLRLLTKKGIIPPGIIAHYSVQYPEEFVAVTRNFGENGFSQSSAYEKFPPYYQGIFNIANKKQPFEFTFKEDNYF